MLRVKLMKPANLHRQRGITLIESLVAIVIAALGILGILGVQMRTLTDTQTTVRRAQAIRLIEDLGERMKVNPNALAEINSYVSPFNATPAVGDCQTKTCTRTELAAHDLAAWKQTVASTLPLGRASIFLSAAESALPAGQARQLGVMIGWRENERDIANTADRKIYRDAFNAGVSRKADGTVSDKDPAICPADLTCHLQYISVPARCAPYFSGGPAQYFCPGF